jgi:hypothetical protein
LEERHRGDHLPAVQPTVDFFALGMLTGTAFPRHDTYALLNLTASANQPPAPQEVLKVRDHGMVRKSLTRRGVAKPPSIKGQTPA